MSRELSFDNMEDMCMAVIVELDRGRVSKVGAALLLKQMKETELGKLGAAAGDALDCPE